MRARGLKPPWILDLTVVAVGVLMIALVLVGARLTSSTLERETSRDRAIATVKLNVGLSHLWLEEAIAGDRSIDVRDQVYGSIDRARARCVALVGASGAGAASTQPIERLCTGLQTFRALAVRRWQSRNTAKAGSRQDQAFDSAFSTTLHLADEAAHSIRVRIAATRTKLNWINAGIVLGVLVLFGGMTLVVGRRAKHLAAHNERLRRVDRLKDNFVASVSHELRTPLTSTLGFLRTLERPDLRLDEQEQRELIGIARVQAERLAELVDDLLGVAEAKTDRPRLRYGDVDLAALLAECRRSTEPLAREQGIALRFATERVPPIRGDRARLAQLLDNLVGNALKFTPPGGSVEVRALGENGHARLEVSDTGPGIPVAEQPYLFERFFRASPAVEQAIPGTGLGLAIAKAIVDAHEGVITVESDEVRGTTVLVQLPVSA